MNLKWVHASEFVLEARELDADRIGAVEEGDEVVGGLLGATLQGLRVGVSGIPNVAARHHRYANACFNLI